MTAALFQWPPSAAFGLDIPKARFYERGTVNRSTRNRFVAQVQRITWAFKLSQDTVNLHGDDDVPEIQVFQLDLKGEDLDDLVLRAIDVAVPTPIIFEVARPHAGERRQVAAHKRTGPSRPIVSDYFSTAWAPTDAPRLPLPATIDLRGLYRGLLSAILPVDPAPTETLAESVERVGRIRRLDREIAHHERRMRNERQFNRRVNLRRDLLDLAAERTRLQTAEPLEQ